MTNPSHQTKTNLSNQTKHKSTIFANLFAKRGKCAETVKLLDTLAAIRSHKAWRQSLISPDKTDRFKLKGKNYAFVITESVPFNWLKTKKR